MSERRGNWERLSSKIVHKNPFYSVREDTVIKPNGSSGVYDVIEGRDAVFVVPLDEHQNIYLVELHRYTNNNLSIEVPSGGIDGQKPLVAAKRELQEETGLIASTWQELGFVHPVNGIICGKNYVFLAKGLEMTSDNAQVEEGITKTLKLPIKEVLAMIHDGRITDCETIAAITLAVLELGLLN